MEDSFFGFDTSAPIEGDGLDGGIAEPPEEEYDALNDETFGSAINSDWEEAHESLVRLTDNTNHASRQEGYSFGSGKTNYYNDISSAASSQSSTPARFNSRLRNNNIADSDLELNLTGMKLDDVDLRYDDAESMSGGRVTMDPSVWATHPAKLFVNANVDGKARNSLFSSVPNDGASNEVNMNAAEFLREHFPSPFQQTQRMRTETSSPSNYAFGLSKLPRSADAPKICTLEDIERSLITQQTAQKKQLQQAYQQQEQQQQSLQLRQQQQQQNLKEILQRPIKTPTPLQQQQPAEQKQQQTHIKGPPGFGAARPANIFGNNLNQPPLANIPQQQQQQQQQPQQASNTSGNRLPPGFPLYPPGLIPHLQQQVHAPMPPHPLLNQSGLPPNFPHPHQRPLPIALNNFAMHPNFNAMRAAAAAAGIHPGVLVPPPQQPQRIIQHPPNPALLMNQQQQYNMFNMRLVQEIQQNHPLLQNTARQAQQNFTGPNSTHHQQRVGGIKLNHHRRDGGAANGNLPNEEYDDYANLMSTRDKHWLIGIQLSQLNTDTPYIDDYYYTVYRERKLALAGDMHHSQAHKDNQLNHPLTQPRGHAQIVLVQLGNKNGTRNGQQRERRNSENCGGNNLAGQDQKTPYIFTPLKFENSLGKLQYGSVTAPRKIIDAEIMSGDGCSDSVCGSVSTVSTQSKMGSLTSLLSIPPGSVFGDMATSTQRKSRHILLHIETLYRIVLKLEDLDNPKAIATIIMKKKKEVERIIALEQLDNANKTPAERAAEAANPQLMNPALKNKFAYKIETKEALVAQLISGLTHDKVVAMLNVRKGKALIRRVMPYIDDHEIRWNVWMGVFSALQNVVKKDREDAEGVMYALYPEFKKQVKQANFATVVRMSSAITLNDKKSNAIFCSRFGISSLVSLILQAEKIYMASCDATLNQKHKTSWRQFLDQLAMSLKRTIQNQTISAAIESDSIKPMMNHFARFKDLKLDPLLALFTDAQRQIH